MKRNLFLAAALLTTACSRSGQTGQPALPIGKTLTLPVRRGLPPVPVPPDNPPTAETIALGQTLFRETRLSADGTISCASCHDPANAFSDRKPFSFGVNNQMGGRNAPTVLNAAFHPVQFWDGRAATLEEQAGGPIANPVEMNLPHDVAASRLQEDVTYRAAFEKAFGPGPITIEKITKAIASFERTLVSGGSAFDLYQYGGDASALSPAAIRGLAIFRGPQRGNCATCHLLGEHDALFTDGKFHSVGAGLSPQGEVTDAGRFAVTKVEADRGAFRTPTLRNIARTAPYMHDGSLKTLRQVVDFYVGGGSSHANLDQEIRPLKLNATDRADLVAFLESLSGAESPPAALASIR